MKYKENIPTNLNEMTLRQYQALMGLVDTYKHDETLLQQRIVQYFTGYSFENVLAMPQFEFDNIIDTVNTCIASKDGKFKTILTLENKYFGFIPHLERISTGEFLGIEKYIDDIQLWHHMMAILYRPIIAVKKFGIFKRYRQHNYQIEQYESSTKYADQMLNIPISDVLGVLVFFWTLRKELLQVSLASLTKQIKSQKLTTTEKESLMNIMDGIQVSMQQLGDNFWDLNK